MQTASGSQTPQKVLAVHVFVSQRGRNTPVRFSTYSEPMPNLVRATILQPDPHVPADRLGRWLAANHVLVRAVPLWKLPVPDVDALGDGVIILGGIMSAHDGAKYSWMEPLKQRMVELVEADVPTVAICLGHQLLAEAFGGQVTVADPGGGEHGAYEIAWRPAARRDPLFAKLATQESSLFNESHSDAVTTLPPGAESLGSTPAYANQAFRIGSAVGVQFHPEASPELMGQWAEIEGSNARDMRRSLQKLDPELSRNGRLLAQAFCGQLRARAVAA